MGTNLRFLVTNCKGRASEVFAFYNDRGECENRIEESRLSCHRFLANAFRLLLHGIAYNVVNLFRLLQLPQAWRSTQIETLRADYSELARASVKPRAAFVYTWPPAGRGNLCSVTFGFQYQLAVCCFKVLLSLAGLGRSIPKKLFVLPDWSTCTLLVSSHHPQKEPNPENSSGGR
jgi:hypothetical protein